MPLSNYQKFCYRIFGDIAKDSVTNKLKRNLEKAHINIRPEAYLATAWMNTIVTIVVVSIMLVFLVVFIIPLSNIDFLSSISSSGESFNSVIVLWTMILISFGLGFLVYFFHFLIPSSKAKSRGKKIDSHLPYALNFISAMSAAGVAPHEIFISLSKQTIYGEVREEALNISKDVSLLGLDIVSALKKSIETTPSERFKEFLQGAIVTIASGGALKSYFMAKADQYMRENRQKQKMFLENLSIMAESYVTAAVAGPLLIMIVLPLLMMIQGSTSQIIILYVFVAIVLPLIHLGFAFGIKSMTPEV